jgi:predicted DNA-binding protein (MmcQ/YjbR family)
MESVKARMTPGRARAALRRMALRLPGAHEDFPWGESVVKVGTKVFVFLGHKGNGLHLSVKLPESSLLALDLPFASPTGYGLARGGWVTATFEADERPPVDLLRRWIEESYRAVAPRRLVAELDAAEPARGARRSSSRRS